MDNNGRITEYDAQQVMLIMIVALTPCFMMGVYVFGLDMLDNMLGGCGLAVLAAWGLGMADNARQSKPLKRDHSPELLAAVITGALIVFGMPSTVPIWIALTGVAIAMIPGRLAFDRIRGRMIRGGSSAADQTAGGAAGKEAAAGADNAAGGAAEYTEDGVAGKETAAGADNTAGSAADLLERAVVTAAIALTVLWLAFREEMTTWPLNDFVETRVSPGDIAIGTTPLGALADGSDLPGLSRMFVGFISGPCGEVSVAAAVIGGVYLVWKKIISPLIPACVLGTIFAAAYVYYVTSGVGEAAEAAQNGAVVAALGPGTASNTAVYLAFYHILSGGAVFGAFFLAPAIDFCGTRLIPQIKTHTAADEAYQPQAADQAGQNAQNSDGQKKPATDIENILFRITFSLGVGLLTMYFRIKGIFVEGMALPVLIMYIAALIAACVICIIRNRKPRANNDSAHAAK